MHFPSLKYLRDIEKNNSIRYESAFVFSTQLALMPASLLPVVFNELLDRNTYLCDFDLLAFCVVHFLSW